MPRKVTTLALSLFLLSAGLGYYVRYHREVPCEVKKVYIPLENLPEAFEGFTIGHLSDIHCGNFKDSKALEQAIALLMAQAPDVIFITGDVIERDVEEIDRFADLLRTIQAKDGVYVILGNHEYGPTNLYKERDAARINRIKAAEQALGWDVLLNENRILEREGQHLAIIGVENYNPRFFPRYGDLAKASQGTAHVPVRLLLSHDPSHWDAEVLAAQPPIDVMFAGHTHGIQFKIARSEGCPLYVYKQYHGTYQQGKHFLYVSSGIGNSRKYGRKLKKREVSVIVLTKGASTAQPS